MTHPAPPVLVLAFNRPTITARVLEAVRAARPARLYFAVDGPRETHAGDAELCRQTRALVDDADWPCPVHRLERERNVGLQRAVVGALDWFFDEVEHGIVFEDDCLPAPELFPFAGELLERFAESSQVMHVSGLNMRPAERFGPYSYFFAGVGHIWGWATWRRAWRLFDRDLADWPAIRHEFARPAPRLRRMLGRKFAAAHAGRKSTWARHWYATTVRHGGLAVIPSVNLVRNVGFGADATHTRGGRHALRIESWGRLELPLSHPPYLIANARYERHLARYHQRSYRKRALEAGRRVLDLLRRR